MKANTVTLTLAAAAFAALMVLSCSPAGGEIYPLTVGSTWNMDLLMTASSDTIITGTYNNTAVEKTNLTSGEEVVSMRTDMSQHYLSPDTTINVTSYSYAREAGDWILSYSDLADSTADTVMSTSPAIGKIWHPEDATAEIIGQEDVSVPAGTYKKAWKVKVTDNEGGDPIYYWYAKGVGLVKAYSEDSQFDLKSSLELTSAKIK